MTRRRPRRANPDLSDFGRHSGDVIGEKLQNLRLLRALDRAGVDPGELESVRAPLVRLAEFDQMLTAALELLDRKGRDPGPPRLERFGEVIGLGPHIRAHVLDGLPREQRREAMRSLEEVPAHEREVWLQVEELRSQPAGGGPAGPLDADEARRVGDEVFTREPTELSDPRVAKQEAKALPVRSALPSWLAQLPVGWLRTIAEMHGLDGSLRKPEIVADLTACLRSPAGLRAAVSDLIGPGERARLAQLAMVGRIPVEAMPPDMQEGLRVPWEWRGGPPPGSVARLRGLGLAFVGTSRGERIAAMPEELREPLLRTLEREHPEVIRSLERAVRSMAAEETLDAPFADRELARWKRADRSVAEHISAAAAQVDRAAIDAFFGEHAHELHEEEEAQFLIEYCALTWRAHPDAPRQMDRFLSSALGVEPDERAILEALLASTPSLYQIVSVDPPHGAELADLLRGGDPVRIDDRALSIQGEPGDIVPGRAYPAGSFRFFRTCGGLLPADREGAAAAWLEERYREYRAETGCDLDRYLAERTQDLYAVVRRLRGG